MLESLVYSAHGEPLGVTHYLVVKETEEGGVSISSQELFPSAFTVHSEPPHILV